jgi:hypothetical protein
VSDRERPELAVEFDFGQEGAAPGSPAPTVELALNGGEPAPIPPSDPPRPAIREVARASRVPSSAAAADVDRLLEAAGLRTTVAVDVTLATPDGIWVAIQPDHPITVGRSDDDAHLVISDASISRRHCRIGRGGDGQVTVEDLASVNGTWVHRGDQRLPVEPGHAVQLEHGDWVRSGPEIALVYVAITERDGRDDG